MQERPGTCLKRREPTWAKRRTAPGAPLPVPPARRKLTFSPSRLPESYDQNVNLTPALMLLCYFKYLDKWSPRCNGCPCVRQPAPRAHFWTRKANDSDWLLQDPGRPGKIRSPKEECGATKQTKYSPSFLSFFTDSFLHA